MASDSLDGVVLQELAALRAWRKMKPFEPMWGKRQLDDAARSKRLVSHFAKAFEAESAYLMALDSPTWIERAWDSGAATRGVAILSTILAAVLGSLALWRGSGATEAWMAGFTGSCWGAMLGSLFFWLAPTVVLGLDPARPWWARQETLVDGEFVEWIRDSMSQLHQDDVERLKFLLVEDARQVYDVSCALRAALGRQAGLNSAV